MFFASSDVNWTSVKVSLQQWDLPLTINISLNGCEYEIHGKTLVCFWKKMKSWWGKDTDQNISVRSLTLYVVWSTTTRTRVSDATAVTFSIKCFNPLKLHRLSGNIFRKWFASSFFIYSRALNKYQSPTVNLIAVMTLLLTSSLHCC